MSWKDLPAVEKAKRHYEKIQRKVLEVKEEMGSAILAEEESKGLEVKMKKNNSEDLPNKLTLTSSITSSSNETLSNYSSQIVPQKLLIDYRTTIPKLGVQLVKLVRPSVYVMQSDLARRINEYRNEIYDRLGTFEAYSWQNTKLKTKRKRKRPKDS